MATILDEILANKRVEVEAARHERSLADLNAAPLAHLPLRNFYGAVSAPRGHGPNLIAEIKRSSPSAGLIRADFDPVAIARAYAAAGAVALSVLTDARYFGGKLEYIGQIKEAVGLPVLRKDFIIDPYQVHESRACGADAILIIGEALPASDAIALVRLARELELSVVLEVHDSERLVDLLPRLTPELRAGVLVGINNRDLRVQRIDLTTTERLAPLVPPGIPIVAESGVATRQDVERLHAAGARALLVGETLMRSGDPALTIRQLFRTG